MSNTPTSPEVTPLVIDRIPQRPEGLTPEQQQRWLMKDTTGYWYAWGRIDQGHPAVLILTSDSATEPSNVGTAWTFGHHYAASEHAFTEGEVGWAPGVVTAWDNFVATGGRSIRHRTMAEWEADQVPNGSAR